MADVLTGVPRARQRLGSATMHTHPSGGQVALVGVLLDDVVFTRIVDDLTGSPDVTHEQLHELGMATANLEAAIEKSPEAFRVGHDHAQVVGDSLIFALSMKGFVVEYDPERAAAVAAKYERAPEQRPARLT